MEIARDDSEDSALSTINRGREIWMEETDCYLNAGETIAEYAKRRLEEEQMQYYTASYTRRFYPDVKTTDIISIHYPGNDFAGTFVITSQNISLGHGASVSESVQKI